jgi:TPR repeat protein
MAQGEQQASRKAGPTGSSPEELFRLGMIYWLGQDVPRDLVEAHKWFNLAALAGDERARQYRYDISREMSPADIAEAQRQARSWLQSH